MIGFAKLDKRTLTNAQRVEIGLKPRRNCNPRGPRGAYLTEIERNAEVFDTPPEVRLAEQLREMFTKWPAWVRR
jgi:hypothetical protein